MAQSQTGKWVSRVGSTGGGKNYRSRRPVNFYGVLGIIVVLGLASIVLARHDYQSSGSAAQSKTPPVIGTTQFAAMGFEVCGTLWPSLTPGAQLASSQLALQADGVVKASPKTAEFAGDNANVAKLALSVPGLGVSTSQLKLPTAGEKKAVTLNTGDAWAAGAGNLSGTWPTVWYHTLQNPMSQAFVAAFSKNKRNGCTRSTNLARVAVSRRRCSITWRR